MPPQSSEQSRWFAQEVQPHGPVLRSWLLARFPALHDVDDLVQEAFVRLLRAHERCHVAAPKAMLFTTARHLALDLLRRGKVVAFEPIAEIDGSFVLKDDVDVAETVSHRQELEMLKDAISTLPERCRQVMTLRMAYQMSQKQIAARLGISENVVEKEVAKGLAGCTHYFAERGVP